MVEVCPEAAFSIVPAQPMPASRRWCLAPWLLVLGCLYFVVLANSGLDDYFNPDDSMNLYSACQKSYARLFSSSSLVPWAGEVRPAGALFYKVIYQRFGFDPLPFHLACFALLSANLALHFALARRLFGDLPLAALALLTACFHGAMWSIYASSGTVYDILCGTFVLIAMLTYAQWRARPRWWLAVLVFWSTLWATQSKEMGYAVPLLLLSYEFCFGPGEAVWRRLLRVAPSGVAACLSLVGLLLHSGPLLHQSDYRPSFSLSMFLETTSVHLTSLFCRIWTFTGLQGLLLLSGCLALALLLRNRVMLFGWLFYNAALLPLAFVPPRHDGYVLYIPYFGCAFFLAGLAAALSRFAKPVLVCALFAVPLAATQMRQSLDPRRGGFGPGGQSLVRELALTAALPGSSTCRRVIVVDDPWGDEKWQSMFIVRLSRRAAEIQVVRTTSGELRGVAPGAGDQVLRYRDHVYREEPAEAYGTSCDSAVNLR